MMIDIVAAEASHIDGCIAGEGERPETHAVEMTLNTSGESGSQGLSRDLDRVGALEVPATMRLSCEPVLGSNSRTAAPSEMVTGSAVMATAPVKSSTVT